MFRNGVRGLRRPRLIPSDEPAHIDALAERSGLPAHELAGVLLALELRELVRQLPGRCYVRSFESPCEFP